MSKCDLFLFSCFCFPFSPVWHGGATVSDRNLWEFWEHFTFDLLLYKMFVGIYSRGQGVIYCYHRNSLVVGTADGVHELSFSFFPNWRIGVFPVNVLVPTTPPQKRIVISREFFLNCCTFFLFFFLAFFFFFSCILCNRPQPRDNFFFLCKVFLVFSFFSVRILLTFSCIQMFFKFVSFMIYERH